MAFTPSFIDLRPVDGVYPDNPFASSNPLQTRDLMKNEETVSRFIGSIKLDYNIFQSANQSLDFNLLGGLDTFNLGHDLRFPTTLQFEQARSLPGTSIIGSTDSRKENLYFNFTHTYYAGENTFTTTAGLQFEEEDRNNVNTVTQGLVPGEFNLDQGPSNQVSQRRLVQVDRGYFVQTEVNLGEAIFFTLGVRGDSSSVNGDEDKFYTYPKTSVSVRLSEYDMWDGLKDTLPEFKMRAAWGQTGNLPLFGVKYTDLQPGVIDGAIGLIPDLELGNADIEPETSEELEIGFDATFTDSRATIEFSYFTQEITDLLLRPELPPSSGYVRQWINGGDMELDGIELALNINPIRTEDFNWLTSLNYYSYDSEITKLTIPAFNEGGFAESLGRYRIQEGWSPTSIIGSARDENGEFIKLGDETPDFQLGWLNEVAWKNFKFSALLDFKEGGEVINLFTFLSDLGGTTADLDEQSGIDRTNNPGTTRFIEDGGYVRLREVRLEYNMPRGMLDRFAGGRISSLNLSLSGRNLKTWTDYFGYDPEVSNFGSVAIGRSVDVAPYPSSKSYYFTVTAGF